MIYHPTTPLEAVTLRKQNADTAVYLAGGTDDLRLNGSAQGKDLIDINGLGLDDIFVQDGKLYIGARCTFNQIIESDLVPEFIKEAAHFCASFTKRNSATVGGNIGLRRQDSYLAAALTAADAVLKSITPHGEEMKPIGEYLQSGCKRLIEYVVLDADRTGWVKRFTNLQPRGCDGGHVRGDLCAERVRQRFCLWQYAGSGGLHGVHRRYFRQRRL